MDEGKGKSGNKEKGNGKKVEDIGLHLLSKCNNGAIKEKL